jgi:hypothetical protein
MNSITGIQALNPAEMWQAWLQQAGHETEAATAAEAHAPELPAAAAPTPAALAPETPVAMAALPAEANAVVLPMAPVLMTPLSLQQGPELRWRVQDGSAWRALFDTAGDDDEPAADPHSPEEMAPPATEAAPDWALALLARLRAAAEAPASAERLRPVLQAWRVGLPVLLASPAGLASLQPGRDATSWCWRRWPARWRTARPLSTERWWAVRLGLAAQGRPRTLRELDPTLRLAPGRVSCELRLDGTAPGISQWAEVLVQAPASASLRTLLGARPSLTWLLCSRPLWPLEDGA